jgi:protein ImuB
MTLWIYLHFPYLQLDSLFTQHQTNLVIVDQRDHRIVQASQLALAQGVKIGMGLGSAAMLCDSLQVHPYDKKSEATQLNTIAQALYLITSDIALFPPNGILLRASNMLTLYHGLNPYWAAIQCQLKPFALRYQFSSGYSALAAMLLAKTGHNQISNDKESLLATVQSHDLCHTELSEKQITQLYRVGIRTVNNLITLPLPELARRFNLELVNYVGRLLGQLKHPIEFFHPPAHFQRHLELLYEIENTLWLEKPLMILLQQLESYLLTRSQVAYELTLTLHLRHDETATLGDSSDYNTDTTTRILLCQSAQGEWRASHWLSLYRLLLGNLTLDNAIQSLTLSIKRSGQLSDNSPDLFSGALGNLSELELISILQAKLGRSQVSGIIMTDDPRPEKSTLLYDAASSAPSRALKTARQRPSLLLPIPQALSGPIALKRGPERIVTGWWDDGQITRDYFIAQDEYGRWLWVFRDAQQQWFIHGQFS